MTPLEDLVRARKKLPGAALFVISPRDMHVLRCWPEPPVDPIACVVLCAALAWIELHQ